LNFELPGQFKKNNLPEPHIKLKSLVIEVFFLAEYVIFTCTNYPLPPPSLPPKTCRKKAKFCKLTFYTYNIKKNKKNRYRRARRHRPVVDRALQKKTQIADDHG
jgi:hypothetical protein